MKKRILQRLMMGAVISGVVLSGSQGMVSNAAARSIGSRGASVQYQELADQALMQVQQASEAALSRQFVQSLPVAPAAVSSMAAPAAALPAGNAVLLVYCDQEGRAKIKECTVNGRAFNYTTDCNIGDYVVVKLDVYPGDNSFDGWYINGERVSTNKEYSFTVKSNSVVCEARMRRTGDYHGTGGDGVSTYNWANQTIRFASGYGSYDTAVTTKFMGTGDSLAAACAPVIGSGRVVRAYNVTCTKNNGEVTILSFDAPQNFVFKIPSELKAPGRVFKMVLVRNGVPVVSSDLDASDDTVTFQSQYPGTFALVMY